MATTFLGNSNCRCANICQSVAVCGSSEENQNRFLGWSKLVKHSACLQTKLNPMNGWLMLIPFFHSWASVRKIIFLLIDPLILLNCFVFMESGLKCPIRTMMFPCIPHLPAEPFKMWVLPPGLGIATTHNRNTYSPSSIKGWNSLILTDWLIHQPIYVCWTGLFGDKNTYVIIFPEIYRLW